MDRFSLDPNILVYSVDRGAGRKHDRAVELLDRLVDFDCVLSFQVLAEFFHVVTRKQQVPANEARELVRDWQLLFLIVQVEARHPDAAMGWVEKGAFSFWDGVLYATVRAAGVTRLDTEGMQHGFNTTGCLIENPFEGNLSVDDLLSGA